MIDLVKSLSSLIKVKEVCTDNTIFRLHYNFTVLALIISCIVVSSKQYVGDPINCIRTHDVPESVMNTYCWIHTTFTVPSSEKKIPGKEIPFPGIDSVQNTNDFKYHKYYQWVCFMLFFQAVLFYFPRWLWRSWEGGKMASLKENLECVFGEAAKRNSKKAAVINYLRNYHGKHDWYAFKYFFCEALAFTNVVGQLFLMDLFFEGEFLKYGLEVIAFSEMDQEDRTDPMIRVFPRVTKCRFFKYGSSGIVETHDALCIMPLNIINEKIYIFMWFWFIILAVLTGLVLLLRLLIVVCPQARVAILSLRFHVRCSSELRCVLQRGSYGDWFVIYMLGRNLDAIVFEDICKKFGEETYNKLIVEGITGMAASLPR